MVLQHQLKNTVLFLSILFISCGTQTEVKSQPTEDLNKDPYETKNKEVIADESVFGKQFIITGANQTEKYIPLLKNKSVGIVGNQTSVIFKYPNLNALLEDQKVNTGHTHLVDSLLALNINIKKVFAPEHGFRGKADAGELVADGKDVKTGLPIISLYGQNKKPAPDSLKDIDILIFDIQDVGVRFYTYISTLHYVMQACAEQNKELLILDRPNPNGHYIDGPTLEIENQSFVGMHPIPLVHGMTIAEYAQMINGEGWLGADLTCKLTLVTLKNYNHQTAYSLPIRPSPNLPNDQAINLYPSLGLFEGTTVNAGRGTEMQFQIFGSPDFPIEFYDFAYTPQANFGAKYPKHQGEVCYGKDLKEEQRLSSLNLQWILDAYTNTKNKEGFFNKKSFTQHAGTEKLQEQIEQGYSQREIKKTWLKDLENFKAMRKAYLIYD